MPATDVVFYKDDDGTVPVRDVLQALLHEGKRKEVAKCRVMIGRLAEKGYELRRPEADYLRDNIHELRVTRRRVHYRVLYFFHGGVAVLSQLITKEGKVPAAGIDRAIRHREKFAADPEKRTLQI